MCAGKIEMKCADGICRPPVGPEREKLHSGEVWWDDDVCVEVVGGVLQQYFLCYSPIWMT